ncbi:MAG: hypothetical protein Q4C89_00765 [Deinococcus sp.]|uniref:hypothetical protein n=1 Tax=Deinococcus sp. TaxID=47478 RepID=UPI0026DC8461|nr:hypothetical protein [Deinococcus sp.]MDO4244540.1 hypothetical protein [Deinococcus sp.]
MTTPRYATDTKVSVSSSQAELRKLFGKYGITSFGFAEQPGGAMLAFQAGGYSHRIFMPVRGEDDGAFAYAGTRRRDAKGRRAAAAQEERARWRALVLMVKAKLEYAAILSQSVESAFIEYRILASGRTVQEEITQTGVTPALTWSNP